jgi:stage II sporulation protein E
MLITGIATAKKEDSIVSGDVTSQIRLEDGKYMLAISDAMGSGADSRRNSKIAISMLERLLGTGFNKETSINLINSDPRQLLEIAEAKREFAKKQEEEEGNNI